MMKRICGLLLSICLALNLCACGGAPSASVPADVGTTETLSWQEQYDLGIRYLSEGNYKEAIIAFTAVIEIDPKQVDAYAKAAEAYQAMGDLDAAIAILEQGIGATGDPALSEALAQMQRKPWGRADLQAEDLNDAQQQCLQDLIAALEQQDRETSLTLLQSGEFASICALDKYGNGNIYAEYGKYRMNLNTDESGASIEARPQNGTGYYHRFHYNDAIGVVDWFASGLCEGWNWNGVYTLEGVQYNGSEQKPEYLHESGQLKDSLLDGVVNVTRTTSDGTVVSEDEQLYENGDYISGLKYESEHQKDYLYMIGGRCGQKESIISWSNWAD